MITVGENNVLRDNVVDKENNITTEMWESYDHNRLFSVVKNSDNGIMLFRKLDDWIDYISLKPCSYAYITPEQYQNLANTDIETL